MMGVTVIKIRSQVVSSQAHTNIQTVANVFICFLSLTCVTFLIWHILHCRWCLDHSGRMSKNKLSSTKNTKLTKKMESSP